ncbi:MAG TPA: SRPBCC domain-containing protein, partial [Usitatibacter sp.]|nr:SRPBCC domain-containing protein [Usitatibacter sp.]
AAPAACGVRAKDGRARNAQSCPPRCTPSGATVIVRFAPAGDKETRVTMTHTGWGDGGEWDKAYLYFDKAWDHVLGNLQKRFAEGPVDWSEWLSRLRSASGTKK